ncbi:MAG: hypothetical protein LBF55_04005 [Prevotellaceae bacterium]|jgi:hypothetical protein|nr:hypothetical protein [Prevotellaceae bacterium]
MAAIEELYIQDANGEYQLVDLPAGQIALNFQEINLLKLESLFVTYSQVVKLPKTQRNCEVFGRSELFDVAGNYAGKNRPCRYYVNSMSIFVHDCVFILDKVSENFEGRIIAEELGKLIEDIKSIKIKDILLPFALKRSKQSINQQDESSYQYAAGYFIDRVIDDDGVYSTDDGSIGFLRQTLSYDLQYTLPFINLQLIVRQALASAGYGFSYQGEKKYYFPIVPKKLDSSASANFKIERFKGTPEGYTSEVVFSNTSSTNDGEKISFLDSSYNFNENSWSYIALTAKNEAKIKIDITVNATPTVSSSTDTARYMKFVVKRREDVTNQAGGWLLDKIFNDDDYSIAQAQADLFWGGNISLEFETYPTDTHYYSGIYYLFFLGEPGDKHINVNGSIYYSLLFDETQAYVGDSININKSIPIETGFDALALFRKITGTTIKIEKMLGETIVNFIPINSILSNIGLIDWSEKLTINKDVINFTGDFARNNYIRFLENEVTQEVDTYNAVVDKESLPKENDIMVINLTTPQVKRIYATNTQTIETVNTSAYKSVYDGSGNIKDFSATDLPLQIVEIVGIEQSASIDGVSVSKKAKKIAINEVVENTYKPILERMFSKLRIVEATFLLDERDIANFNQLAPVYVDYYGAYFFVNKVSNWMAGKPCKVELIKL